MAVLGKQERFNCSDAEENRGPPIYTCIYAIHITFLICDGSFGEGRLSSPILHFFYGRGIIYVALLKKFQQMFVIISIWSSA